MSDQRERPKCGRTPYLVGGPAALEESVGMESSLHRQLKEHYAGDAAELEVKLGDYRIDAVVGDQLIEIQHGSLAAIRQKVKSLLRDHCVTVIKPIIRRKRIIKQKSRNGPVTSQRWSPKRGVPLNLFDDLVYFTSVFPHANLTLETPLVEIEELRYPGHGRRRRGERTTLK